MENEGDYTIGHYSLRNSDNSIVERHELSALNSKIHPHQQISCFTSGSELAQNFYAREGCPQGNCMFLEVPLRMRHQL